MLLKTKPHTTHTREPGADKFQIQEASCLATQLAYTGEKVWLNEHHFIHFRVPLLKYKLKGNKVSITSILIYNKSILLKKKF